MFYNDRASFQTLIQMMRSERDRMDENSPLMYHIHLVELLAVCTEGKNVYTEIKCNSLLPLDDIVRVVTHEDCIPEVSEPFSCLCTWRVELWPAHTRPHGAETCSSFHSEISVGGNIFSNADFVHEDRRRGRGGWLVAVLVFPALSFRTLEICFYASFLETNNSAC